MNNTQQTKATLPPDLDDSQKYLPSFANEWMQQWKSAAPKLQEIRDRELRALGKATGQDASAKPSRKLSHAEARNHGLAIQQAWFMRFMLLQRNERDKD